MESTLFPAIGGVVGGCTLAGVIANYAIKKALSDLDSVVSKVHEIEKAMAAMFVRLNQLAEHEIMLREHSKKLAFYDGLNHERSFQAH